jgi:hypothetical protein
MTTTTEKTSSMTVVEKTAEQFDNDVLKIAKELRRIQALKCRLKKQKGKKSYQTEMTKVLNYEETLKEARQLLNPTEKHVTTFEQKDVDKLDYDEVIKAIRSIQSKKTLSKWLTTVENDNDEYRRAVVIEKMLIERRNKIKPVDNEHLRKTELITIIETIKSSGKISNERIIELLEELI